MTVASPAERRRARVAGPRALASAPRRRGWRPAPWLIGAACYALSWPLVEGLNTSWLAWGAFVPLLLEVERHDRFGPFAWRVLAFMGLAGVVSCWWWFVEVPADVRTLAWAGGVHEILLSSVPLLALYPLTRALGTDRALWALVLVWPLWEWAYNHWEFSISSILLGYTQAGSVWLVQYADLFGVWAVTAWVVLFNVLLAQAARAHGWSRPFRARALRVGAVMLAVPLAYASLRAATLAPADEARVAAVYTDFDPVPDADGGHRIERLAHLTDSTAYFATRPPDLYVWPEGALPYAWTAESRPFIRQAVADWQRPLLTGHTGLEGRAPGDSARFNRVLLLDPGADDGPVYAKRRLMPFREGLPHARWLGGVPALADYGARANLFEPGHRPTLMAVETVGGARLRVATPICHEQQFPGLWADWVGEGADLFVLLSFESWFGDRGFEAHFLGITRLRAIETRRSVVRVSNGGPTAFIDASGRVVARAEGEEGALTEPAAIYRGRTLYARAPWLFPLLCALGLAGLAARARYAKQTP